MAQDFSFDVVSQIDLQGVDDAVNACLKEIANRYDFKGSAARVEFDRKAAQITLFADDAYKLKSLYSVLQNRLVKRQVALKNVKPGPVEQATGSTVRQLLKLQQAITPDQAKAIVQEIKRSGQKVQASIQSDQVRVSSRSKDTLQSVMALIRAKDFDVDLQFTNYR